jgi:predicted nuclease of predicted toxin-antitoxin system
MTIVADENIEKPIIESLREHGFTVISIQELSPGVQDSVVLDSSKEDDRILLTSDKDFGELVYKRGHTHNGIVLTRLHGLPLQEKARIVTNEFLGKSKYFFNAFSVITDKSTRIRSRGGDPEFH